MGRGSVICRTTKALNAAIDSCPYPSFNMELTPMKQITLASAMLQLQLLMKPSTSLHVFSMYIGCLLKIVALLVSQIVHATSGMIN
ncbi:hypothetical protein QJS04_geneDACA009561 [Acorus gramineus]|uniref:Uncharacterized protein n=1 Tax=Acorus gramineus TaxID=55184 RepID=A0AAV9AI65_ACOGR|nr:hypothetical protein QJS04_geneDACA009561 [Acorus gramineus]